MKKDYVPVLVDRNGKSELWIIDVTNLGVTELIKLKKELTKIPYSKTIQTLDALIKQDVEKIAPFNCINSGSYMRTYKKSKKEAKQRKKTKNRRR